MASEVRTLEIRLSPPVYVRFLLMKCETRLQKLMQLEDRSGRLRPQIYPNPEYLPHILKAGRGYEPDIVILSTRLKGVICLGCY